ncbi:Trypsin-like peptidase domain-containing protein [Tindallia magadiensis]|uniref:Trypsin-like peptidase domain-containing protein n=1 Tax=Tindallia magadiensis TaxID=69895 RepID=A0A1I3CES9_9FIRM|nr:S1C family serine protease [Tindallia magadiensis]SFH73058.1 Trypsin-like peptidase domain-containing protein [Tindallia magadiensis]
MANKENSKEAGKKISKSLAITMIAGITFMLLFVYGTAGFLLFQYFKHEQPEVASAPVESYEEPEEEEKPESREENKEPEALPSLQAPPSEMVAAYQTLESPMERSMEQVASLKESVVQIEAGESQGSGVLISEYGHIVTNYHVIESSPYMAKAYFESEDGTVMKKDLMLLGYDSRQDLAILQLKNREGINQKPIPLGAVSEVSAGQRIVTIGSPRGLINTVSDGIVSGLRETEAQTLIQITAPISPGNSGGALLNMKGELIGLTTFKIDQSENLNFAISASDIKQLIDQNPQWINP